MFTPGIPIQLDSKSLTKLGTELSDLITDQETQYARYFRDIAVWWRWYNAIPRTKEQHFPWQGASNIIIPRIQISADAFASRAYAQVFGGGRDVWIARNENEDPRFEAHATNLPRWLNWTARGNDFDYTIPAYDAMLELAVIGCAVHALSWRADIRHVFARQRGNKGRIISRPVRFAQGALVEHIPRHMVLWDTACDIGEAPMVARKLNLSWPDIIRRATDGSGGLQPGWVRDNLEAIKGDTGSEGPDQAVEDEHKRLLSRQNTNRQASLEPHDIREVHIDFPILNAMGMDTSKLEARDRDGKVIAPGREDLDHPSIGILVTLHRKSRRVLRLTSQPYHFPYKPFVAYYLNKIPGRSEGHGLAKRLEMLQAAETTTVNQSIDAQTRANAIWAKSRNPEHFRKPLDPSVPIYDPDGSFEPLNIPSSNIDSMRTLAYLQAQGERISGQSDPLLGRETRSGGHPAPATSTLALMEQGNVVMTLPMELIRRGVSRTGEALAILYQQFEENHGGRLQKILGVEDARVVEDFLFPDEPIPGTLSFDVLAMNERDNPDTAMRRAVVTDQMVTQFWTFTLQVLQGALNPQAPPLLRQAAIQSIRSKLRSTERFLRSADVDDPERFLALAQQANTDTERSRVLGDFAGAAREVTRNLEGNAGPGVGGGGFAAPGGAPNPVGGFEPR